MCPFHSFGLLDQMSEMSEMDTFSLAKHVNHVYHCWKCLFSMVCHILLLQFFGNNVANYKSTALLIK